MTIIRKPYDERDRTYAAESTGPAAHQSFKDECDINNILAKYVKTGAISHYAQHGAAYGDYASIDYQQAQNQLIAARDMFSQLPAKVRKQFDNDPAAFLTFVDDPDNAEQMVEMGLRARTPNDPPADRRSSPGQPNDPPEAAEGGGQPGNGPP